MKWSHLTIILLMIAASLEAGIDSPQFQFNTALSQRFAYGLEPMIYTQTRLGEGGLREFELMPELIWHYAPQWDFSVGYDQMQEWDKEGMKMTEEMIFATATWRLRLGPSWFVTTQQRLETGNRSDGTNPTTFRNLTKLTYTGRFPKAFQPYLSNEIYWQLNPSSEISKDRLRLGLNYSINRVTAGDIFFMLEDNKTNNEITPIFGLGLQVLF